jgi:hypothetical protein
VTYYTTIHRDRHGFVDPGAFVYAVLDRRVIPRDYLVRFYASKRAHATRVAIKGCTEPAHGYGSLVPIIRGYHPP